jgi:hypothetical protein
MSQTFQITWVGDRTRDWETDKGQFTAYKIALAGYDPSENDSEAGKTVEWSRRRDAQAPAPGDEVFGHVEIKSYDWGNKYVFKTDQAQNGQPPARKVDAGALKADAARRALKGTAQDSDWWYAKDRRISRAGILQAVVASGEVAGMSGSLGGYVTAVNNVTDALLASLDERTPHPSAPKAQPPTENAPKPVIEDVTPKRSGEYEGDGHTIADDDIPF